MKRHLNVDYARDDDVLTAMIQAADDFVERETDRAFVTQSWLLTLNGFPTRIYLSKPPVNSVTTLKYYDSDNTLQNWDSANYYVITSDNVAAYIDPVTSWPAIYTRPDAVQITYQSGDTTPAAYLHLVKMLAAHFYTNREAEIVGTISSEIKLGAQRLLNLLKAGRYV